MVRGNNGEYILSREEDKAGYINVTKRYKERYNFKLHAYCIMDNHAHMLIEVEEIALNRIMQGIQQVYTQRYNKKIKEQGMSFNKDIKLLYVIKMDIFFI